MSEINKAVATLTPEEIKAKTEDIKAKLLAQAAERKAKRKEAQEAMGEGKGVLTLETPFKIGEKEITKLNYDFNQLTGLEYTDAMDSDPNAQQIYKITYRQALALFAIAAAKQTEFMDMRDILEHLGGTDAIECVQLATLFFSASTRAGQMRISKWQ